MAVDWVIETCKHDLWTWFRPRYSTFLRAIAAYVRANASATPAQVAAYAGTLEVVLTGVTNATILNRIIAGLGLSATDALAWMRSMKSDDTIQATDPFFGRHPMSAMEETILRLNGSPEWGHVKPADSTGIVDHRVAEEGNQIARQTVSGTLDGVFYALARTCEWPLVDGARTKTEWSDWVVIS